MEIVIWLAVDEDGTECIYQQCPQRRKSVLNPGYWSAGNHYIHMLIPKGTIKQLIDRELTWEDEPVVYKGENTTKKEERR